jgi:hypothetical protein
MDNQEFAVARHPFLPLEAHDRDVDLEARVFSHDQVPGVQEDARDVAPAVSSDDVTPSAEHFNALSQADAETKGGWQRAREWAARHKGKLALGAAAVSATLTLTMNPLGEVTHQVVEAAPAVGIGIATSETMFIGGLAMMAASVGSKIGNPLKLKERLPEICEKANDSKLFKAGFWVNTVGAVGSAAIISTGVIAELPPESYGVLGFAAADLAVTVAVRKAMLSGIKHNAQKNAEA